MTDWRMEVEFGGEGNPDWLVRWKSPDGSSWRLSRRKDGTVRWVNDRADGAPNFESAAQAMVAVRGEDTPNPPGWDPEFKPKAKPKPAPRVLAPDSPPRQVRPMPKLGPRVIRVKS